MRPRTLVLATAMMLGALLAGCSNDEGDASDTTAVALPATTTIPEPAPTTTVAVVTTTTEAMDPDAACIECHTDQEALLALAVEPEDTESLSSGEG